MTINYIILLHKEPSQAKRMINALTSLNTFFYLHIDKKVDIEPFKRELGSLNQVKFLDNKYRCDGLWGGFGLVQAALNGLKQILLDNRTGYCVLLSGQDYPLHSPQKIENFFSQNLGKEFISCTPITSDRQWWPDPDGMGRLNRYNFRKSADHYDFILFPSFLEKTFYKPFYIKELAKLLIRGNFFFPIKLFKQRKFPKYAVPYRGDQWWALTDTTVKAMFDYLNKHSDFLPYFKDSIIPDEFFFQSVIKNIVADSLILPNLTYTNWKREGVTLPLTCTIDDKDELMLNAPQKLYARKFNTQVDSEILNFLDSINNS